MQFIPRLVIHDDEVDRIKEISAFFEEKTEECGNEASSVCSDAQNTSTTDVSTEDVKRELWMFLVFHLVVKTLRHTPTFLVERLPQHVQRCFERITTTDEEIQALCQTSLFSFLRYLTDWIRCNGMVWFKRIKRTKIYILCSMLSMVIPPFLLICYHLSLPLGNIEDGPEKNKIFNYCSVPVALLTLVSAFMKLCNYALPEVQVPLSTNLLITLLCTAEGTALYILLIKGVITQKPVFPVPFSVLSIGLVATLSIAPILCICTPKKDQKFRNLIKVFTTCLSVWLYLAAAVAWTLFVNRLQDKPWCQSVASLLYPIIRFICKIPISANITSRLNPRKSNQMNNVVDVIFIAASCFTFPYICNGWSFGAFIFSQLGSTLWRVYIGPDRINLFCSLCCLRCGCSDTKNQDRPSLTFLQSAKTCIGSSAPKIHQLTMQNSSLTLKNTSTADDDSSQDSVEDGHDVWLEIAQDSGSILFVQSSDINGDYDFEVGIQQGSIQDIFRSTIGRETAKQKSSSTMNEEDEEAFSNRYLYHILDAMTILNLFTTIYFSVLAVCCLVRNLSTKNHLTLTFQIDDEQWRKALTFGWIAIAVNVCAYIGMVFLLRRKMKHFEELKGLNVWGVLYYFFVDHYVHYAIFILTASTICSCSMINHYGFDYSFEFAKVAIPIK